MRGKELLKVVILVAAVLVAVVIVLGTLQARAEFGDVPESPTPVTVANIPTPRAAALPPAPSRQDILTGNDILFQVRGGDNPCRYLYTSNRVGTFAGTEIGLWFVAGTWDENLALTDEMHLYGPTGPHDFAMLDAAGQEALTVQVGRGETVRATVVFGVGPYRLYDRMVPEATHVSEIFARPVGQPGYVPKTGWCDS